MKKILFLTAFPPNTNTGGGKNTLGLIELLSEHNFIDLIYWKASNDEEATLDVQKVNVIHVFKISHFKKLCNVLSLIVLSRYFTVRFNISDLIKLRKVSTKNKYDLIVFDHSQLLIYSWFIGRSSPKSFIALDIITQRVSRASKFGFPLFTYLTEYFLLRAPGLKRLTLNEKDVRLAKSWFGVNMHTLNIPIDNAIKSLPKIEVNESNFSMFGNWRRRDNLDGLNWLIRDVLPFVERNITIDVFGVIDDYSDSIQINLVTVRFHGFVDNPYISIANSAAMLAPIFTGAGVKVKVIESLGCGCPVIGTDIAFEGISLEYADFMVRADSNTDYIRELNDTHDVSGTEREAFRQEFLRVYTAGIDKLF